MENRGKTCVFIGYVENQSKNVYHMLHPETKRIIMSHDIYWLENSWRKYTKISGTTKTMVDNDSDGKEDNTNKVNEEKETKSNEATMRAMDERHPMGLGCEVY